MTTSTAKIVVLGGGESGVGAAILAHVKGFAVFVSDKGKIAPRYKTELEQWGIGYEEGVHTEALLLEANFVIKSPGIPDTVALVQKIRAAGIAVIDEIEFAAQYTEDSTVIAITGSNGKTTTTSLVWHLLTQAGKDAALVGNIGFSFAREVALRPKPYYVLEISSFQLDGTVNFCPHIAILLNITPDHLDRYAYQLRYYIASKFKIIQNQSAKDWLIYNADDENITSHLETARTTVSRCPIGQVNYEGGYLQAQGSHIAIENLTLKGRHNRFNAACAVAAAKLVGIGDDALVAGLRTFLPVPHRLQLVGTHNGVAYINDSKATNVDAVYYALEAMTQPVVWVVGGIDKGNDYTPLLPFLQEKVRAIVALGKDNSKIIKAFEGLGLPIATTDSMAAALAAATQLAREGDAVLLSPACASFDLFKDFNDRGNQFTIGVNQLQHPQHP